MKKECGACGNPKIDGFIYKNEIHEIHLCELCSQYIKINGYTRIQNEKKKEI